MEKRKKQTGRQKEKLTRMEQINKEITGRAERNSDLNTGEKWSERQRREYRK